MAGASLAGTAASAKGGKNAQEKQDTRITAAQKALNDYYARYEAWQKGLSDKFPEFDASGVLPLLESLSEQSSSGEQYTAPDFGENKGIADMLTQRYSNEVKRNTGLPLGTLEGRMRDVNSAYDIQSQQERNALARKGIALPFGATSAADTSRQDALLSTQNAYQNEDRQARIENERILQAWLDAIKGTRSTYNSRTSSRSTTPWTGFAELLAPKEPTVLV